MLRKDAELMDRYEFGETYEVKEENDKKVIVLTGYFYEGINSWHKEDRNIRIPMEEFLGWRSRSPESSSYESHVLKYAIDVRDMNKVEAMSELELINPVPLNLTAVNDETPCGRYIDMTFAV